MRKEGEERRNEILEAADELFSQKGFDSTSTKDILEKVGIARGTLYYHFNSKEDILDALIECCSDRLLSEAQKIGADKSISLNERIVGVVLALNLCDGSSKQIMGHIHKPQNALMHKKIEKIIINGVPPILSEIIQEGIEQGLFNTPFPYECMEMVVVYMSTVFDDEMVEMTNEERAARILAFVFNVERLLGAANGSLMSVVMQMFGNRNEGRIAGQ